MAAKANSAAEKKAAAADEVPRYVHVNNDQIFDDHHVCSTCKGVKFATNYISTTKYTLLTFVPRNLFEQFSKKANFYFLVIAILSTTSFSPKTPLVSIVPLVFVLSVTAIKEALEDYRRYTQDVEMNNTPVRAYRNSWVGITWADVHVGDILMLTEGASFPSDLVLLKSSAAQGICNIETSNLDGETNLKIKEAIPETYNIPCSADGEDYPSSFEGILQSAPPNEKMDRNSWKGNFIGLSDKPVPLNMSQLLLRGCTLKNTKWVLALVAFTGLDTKLMQQNRDKKVKRSHVERTVDNALYIIFALQALFCAGGAIAVHIWADREATKHWYLPYNSYENISLTEEAGFSVFSFLILLDLFVPISLYVSMELVKFTQAWYINKDLDMYYPENDIPACARTSNLNEELGQIGYVFSDKTGTLTRNMMEFLRCTVAAIPYGPGEMEKTGDTSTRLAPRPGVPPFPDAFRFADTRLVNNLVNHHESEKEIDQFLTALAVCHTVIPEFPTCEQDHEEHTYPNCKAKVKYQAASPDELALVLAAVDAQYYFYHRQPELFTIAGHTINGMRAEVNILGKKHTFQILEILEFTSSRKRMSTIFKDPRDNKIKVVCKGADNVIRERCNKKSLQKFWKTSEGHLQDMAAEGLRTLVIGCREISNEEFNEWWQGHLKAKSSMNNREAEISASSDRIEKDFNMVGATAIEDRLQDGVPEAIARLARAGLKIWVLTGDKVETAINIGRSCNLLTPQMRGQNLMVVDIDESLDDEEARRQTLQALEDCRKTAAARTEEEKETLAIVVSGKALGFVFPIRKLDPKTKKEIIPPAAVLEEEERLQLKFLEICSSCKSVICCRMSPKQKSQVVRLVRDFTTNITLAIGDGANDVAMIESAHVGVGIEGLEGKQAVMSSDYSLGQFRFLENLLLVHGAWSYRRLSLLILYCFYKNITISLAMLWFSFYSGFSAQIFFDALSGAAYNMIFTAFPVLLAAVFNRDVSKQDCLRFPELYKGGIYHESFNMFLLFIYLAQGFLHSLILFFFTINTFSVSASSQGLDNDLWMQGTAFYTCMVLLATSKISLLTTTWVKFSHIFIYGSVAVWWLWGLSYSAFYSANPDMYWVFYRLLGSANFWLLILLAPLTCLIPELCWIFLRKTFFFTRTDIVKERAAGYITGPDLVMDTPEDLPELKITAGSPEEAKEDAASPQPQGVDATSPSLKAKAASPAPVKDKKAQKESWEVIRDRVRETHLGYVPFVEDETGDAFVMGQQEFLKRYLVVKGDGGHYASQMSGTDNHRESSMSGRSDTNISADNSLAPADTRSGPNMSKLIAPKKKYKADKDLPGDNIYSEDREEHKVPW